MSKLKMNCGYCGRKCDLDKDFCIPQDSVYVCKSCYEWQNRVADLEAKLAENQKKKEDFKTMYFNKCLDYEHLHEKFDDKCAEFELKEYDYKQTIFEKDQDKIDFAIEQLEQLRHDIWTNQADDGYTDMQVDLYVLNDVIDVRIMQIKEGK